MSRMRVICEKINTRWRCSFSRFSSLSSSTILPQFYVSLSLLAHGDQMLAHGVQRPVFHAVEQVRVPSHLPQLHHHVHQMRPLAPRRHQLHDTSLSSPLRRRRSSGRVCTAPSADATCPRTESSPISAASQSNSKPTGSVVSTSLFSRRSMKGASSWCSCLIIRSFAATLAVSSKLNSWSNVSCEPNTSGIKKLSSAHSSCRFFSCESSDTSHLQRRSRQQQPALEGELPQHHAQLRVLVLHAVRLVHHQKPTSHSLLTPTATARDSASPSR